MMLELQATPEEVMRAVEALREFGHANQVPVPALFGLALALEECGSNIVNHSLKGDPQKRFQVIMERTGTGLTLELRDPGPEFDPTKAIVVETREGDDDRPPGGWGIVLVRRYMDEIRYRRENGENVLRLTKRLPVPAEPSRE
jgi:serine/threonine-protein kinase RsbW